MSTAKKWFLAMAACAFLSVISFFQINSYAADKNGLNGLWLVAGIVIALAAVFCLYKVVTNSDKGDGGDSTF